MADAKRCVGGLMKLFRRSFAIVAAFLIFVSIPAVCASWVYSEWLVRSEDEGISMQLNELYYAPEAVVPDTPGDSHLLLINNLITHNKYGLNSGDIVHKYLNNPGDLVFADQHATGGNISHLLLKNTSESETVYFVVEMVSETVYNVYTLRTADLKKDANGNDPLGQEIDVYKTIIVKGENGRWDSTYSYLGCAPVNEPDANKVWRAVDVTKWHKKIQH